VIAVFFGVVVATGVLYAKMPRLPTSEDAGNSRFIEAPRNLFDACDLSALRLEILRTDPNIEPCRFLGASSFNRRQRRRAT